MISLCSLCVAIRSRNSSFLFGSFSFVETVDKWITGLAPDASFLLARPCEKIGQEAEKYRPLGSKARPVGSSGLLSAWSTIRPDTIVGVSPDVQGWSGGHITNEEIVP